MQHSSYMNYATISPSSQWDCRCNCTLTSNPSCSFPIMWAFGYRQFKEAPCCTDCPENIWKLPPSRSLSAFSLHVYTCMYIPSVLFYWLRHLSCPHLDFSLSNSSFQKLLVLLPPLPYFFYQFFLCGSTRSFFLNSRTLPKFQLNAVKVLNKTVFSLKLLFQNWGEILSIPLDNYLPQLYFLQLLINI